MGKRSEHIYLTWINSKQTGKRWVEALITKVWDVAWDQWQHRNGIAHGETTDEFCFDMDEIDCQIQDEFIRGYRTLPKRERHLFSGTLEELLDKSARFRRAWLENVTSARKTQQSRDLRNYNQERTHMTRWLQS